MRLTIPPGYRSPDLEDRRQEFQTLDQLLALKDAARRQAEADAAATELEERDQQTPPWLRPSTTTETLVGTPQPADIALLGDTPVSRGGYDLASAQAAGMRPKPDAPNKGHMGSRSPAFISPADIPEGLILKGPGHPTERLAFLGEQDYGNQLVSRNGRMVSVPPWDIQPTDHTLDMLRLLAEGR